MQAKCLVKNLAVGEHPIGVSCYWMFEKIEPRRVGETRKLNGRHNDDEGGPSQMAFTLQFN
jgi:hypothetical protein